MDSIEYGQRLLAIKRMAVEHFTREDWLELAVFLGRPGVVRNHSRLLRGMDFGDSDYGSSALEVLSDLAKSPIDIGGNLPVIEAFIASRFESAEIGEFVSSHTKASRKLIFSPQVFEIPVDPVDDTLVSVMMPFSTEFDAVYKAIDSAVSETGLRARRADDIWEHSVVVQDVFSLSFRSRIVVCDFSGKNPNVFYEAGIAHTLGKHVVPVAQTKADIPFDVGHHRILPYLNNGEGLKKLRADLARRLRTLSDG